MRSVPLLLTCLLAAVLAASQPLSTDPATTLAAFPAVEMPLLVSNAGAVQALLQRLDTNPATAMTTTASPSEDGAVVIFPSIGFSNCDFEICGDRYLLAHCPDRGPTDLAAQPCLIHNLNDPDQPTLPSSPKEDTL